jgi:hypothetical protein
MPKTGAPAPAAASIAVPITDLTDNERLQARKNDMKIVESKLNRSLYVCWHRKYIAYVLWSNIGTPLNLSITLLTALTAGSGSSGSFLPESAVIGIQISVLIISALNTFFRPYVKANDNLKFMLEIQRFGARFDEIYYTPKGCFKEADYLTAMENYTKVFVEFNKYVSENSLEHKNYIVDIVYWILACTCAKRNDEDKRWVMIEYV